MAAASGASGAPVRGLRRRAAAAIAAHLPAAALLASGAPLPALAALAAAHAVWLWGTLRPGSTLFGPVRRRLDHADGVWLTIDDGPSDDTLAILDALGRAGARATFFLVADRAGQRPDLVAAIRARGHTVGNHTQSHPSARFWRLGPRRMQAEIAGAQAQLAALCDGVAPRHFRAVAGHANPFVEPVLHALGLERVAWSARGYDAVTGDVATVLHRIERDLEPGAIVLLHEGAAHGRCPAIVEAVLAALARRELRTTLPDSAAFGDDQPVVEGRPAP
ncbi:polysaccharide deacetylase family protein [Coralloluteibacterium stylophorae]|uniref:Polysaccharide deacetylase family protein n=1 Tax=Coralloluteibacterium stylophorae TaxID=1776034 RepID=A0A8J8AX57_9GAMM|nr:polysaccharide deacetylase family protein [Coralloluteibacterium stylophorae]MBS7458245.1 polysaccharide deacetylase family protein [Coralloluteibacterium stylophorae]